MSRSDQSSRKTPATTMLATNLSRMSSTLAMHHPTIKSCSAAIGLWDLGPNSIASIPSTRITTVAAARPA